MWWFVDDVPCFSLFQLTFFRLFSFRVYYPWDEGWEDGSWYLKKMGIPFWFGLILRFPDVFGGAVPIMSSYLLKRSFFCYPIFIQWLGPWGVEVRGAFFRSFDHGIFESPWYPQNAIILPCHHSKYQSRARAVGGSPFTRCLFFSSKRKCRYLPTRKTPPGPRLQAENEWPSVGSSKGWLLKLDGSLLPCSDPPNCSRPLHVSFFRKEMTIFVKGWKEIFASNKKNWAKNVFAVLFCFFSGTLEKITTLTYK